MYKTLNDAALNPDVDRNHRIMFDAPGDGQGSIEVWYARNPTFDDGGSFIPEGPNSTHVKVGTLCYRTHWEARWGAMQGENWSPNGEARDLIRSLGLHHTSMSVGDVLVVNYPNDLNRKTENWMVADPGWKAV